MIRSVDASRPSRHAHRRQRRMLGVLYGSVSFAAPDADAPAARSQLNVRRIAARSAPDPRITGTISTVRSSAATPAPRSGIGKPCPTISRRATRDYARACASIGINGAVLTNVNADALSLTPALSAIRRRRSPACFGAYGIKVYLIGAVSPLPWRSAACIRADPARCGACAVGGATRSMRSIATSPTSAASWSRRIPKASRARSDYGRSHADGANLLAAALAPHGGVVMWRAFVYADHQKRGPGQTGLR